MASRIRGRDDETDTLSRGSFCTGNDGGAGSGGTGWNRCIVSRCFPV
ncbi:MAG: hypothetical protein PHR89_05145 [Bacilli bacterium]|nr:hypothetical protein [Bacilli bacterium]